MTARQETAVLQHTVDVTEVEDDDNGRGLEFVTALAERLWWEREGNIAKKVCARLALHAPAVPVSGPRRDRQSAAA